MARLMPDVVTVFEVLSPSSRRNDRVGKPGEYLAVASIRSYFLLERDRALINVFQRSDAGDAWITSVLAERDTLRMPEIGVEVPVAELYRDLSISPRT